jgi:hypothetical protein
MNAIWTALGSKPFPSKTLTPTSNHLCHGTARHGTARNGTAVFKRDVSSQYLEKHVKAESG